MPCARVRFGPKSGGDMSQHPASIAFSCCIHLSTCVVFEGLLKAKFAASHNSMRACGSLCRWCSCRPTTMPALHGSPCQTCCSPAMLIRQWLKAAACTHWVVRPARQSTGTAELQWALSLRFRPSCVAARCGVEHTCSTVKPVQCCFECMGTASPVVAPAVSRNRIITAHVKM